MIINLKDLVPTNWNTREIGSNKIKVGYKNLGRGNSPKPFILPKTISVDERFVEAMAMYMGDGKLSADPIHLGFASIDVEMVKFVLDFFMQVFSIKLKDMTITFVHREFNSNVLLDCSRILRIPSSKFRLQQSLRSRNPVCDIQITGKIFRIIFGKLMDSFLSSDFLLNRQLRRAFLRGLFAAEGNIAINHHENYIVCMQYCLGLHEKRLLWLIKRALKMEGITFADNVQKQCNSHSIVITNWKNYLKCWKMDLFRLNDRKEYNFLSKVKITKFSCSLKPAIKKDLFNIKYHSHRQVAFLIGILPSAYCLHANNKSEFLNIEYVIKLSKLADIPLDKIRKNIIEFRVNDITQIDDKEFIDFVFELKKYTV
ncbi:MAG: hypothetical protein ABIB41_11380 [Nitrospirota bacterium]